MDTGMRRLRRYAVPWLMMALLAPTAPLQAAEKIRALIVDGQNNHNWREGTPILKWILDSSGRFAVDVTTTPESLGRPRPPRNATAEQKQKIEAEWREKKEALEKEHAAKWGAWRPSFADYGVVVLNYTGEDWPEPVREGFLKYVKGGGGVVVVHAADNAFGNWEEYNKIIAVGGWGGRNEKSGPYLRWRDGKTVRDDVPGPTAGHGPQHEFLVETRQSDHPITKGMPPRWRHAIDELYQRLSGPAENVTLLATAFADPKQKGSGEHEPVMLTVSYGQGRVFHTVLGHGGKAMSGLGFQVYLQRGAEWAATGQVTFPPVKDAELPEDKAAIRQPPPDVMK